MVDEENIEIVKPEDMFKLADKFGIDQLSIVAVQVIILGLEPTDKDPDWSPYNFVYVSNLMSGKLDGDQICRGRVVFRQQDIMCSPPSSPRP